LDKNGDSYAWSWFTQRFYNIVLQGESTEEFWKELLEGYPPTEGPAKCRLSPCLISYCAMLPAAALAPEAAQIRAIST
jgi:hypothetical protein